MPPKAKIDKKMIVEAAFAVVRKSGIENLNARTIAEKLGCSTQPVLWYFKTIDEIKQEVYIAVDEYHSAYLIKDVENGGGMKSIGTNYIRFGYEEKNLFRFLMQSNTFTGQMQNLFDDERLLPILEILSKQLGYNLEKTKKYFKAIYYPVHGIASLLANNSIEYSEDFRETLDVIMSGVLKEMENE